MKLVFEIDDEIYNSITTRHSIYYTDVSKLIKAICNAKEYNENLKFENRKEQRNLDISIGEAIEDLLPIQAYFNGATQSVDLVIEIMQKYQKIEKIITDNDNDGRIGRQVRELVNDSH